MTIPMAVSRHLPRFPRVRFLCILLSCLATAPSWALVKGQSPAISGTPPTTATVGKQYLFQPMASDPNGDKLTFQMDYKPSWATFDVNTGRLSGTPGSGNVGTFSNIKIMVNDGAHWVALPAFSIKVNAPAGNTAPSISGTPGTSASPGAAYVFQPAASDPEGSRLAFAISGKPSWAAFDTTTGRFIGFPTTANVGSYANIRISVSDGNLSAALPAFTITVGSTTANRPPVISGTPMLTDAAGSAYSFRPTASDPEGKTISFSIQNKPSWAAFSTTTGTLSGTPGTSQLGTYANIVITASDGQLTAALPAFAITVTQIGQGSATLSWLPPTLNTDGTQLTNLGGYKIYYGTSAGSLTSVISINTAGIASYVVDGLTPGAWYFAITARTTSGVESNRTPVVTKTIM